MKKLLFILFSVLLTMPAFAADGDTFDYTYEGKTLRYTVISEADKTVKMTYRYDETLKGDLVIPEKVSCNGNYYTVIEIEEGVFMDWWGLTSVTIPNSVTTIGSYAFFDSRDLKSVIIGSSVAHIGKYAFAGCYNLKIVTSEAVVPPVCDNEAFGSEFTIPLITLYVPEGSEEAYHNAEVWRDLHIYGYVYDNLQFDNDGWMYTVISATERTVRIRGYMYDLPSNLILPETIGFEGNHFTVTAIGEYAFYMCSGLTSVTVPNSVTTIEVRAFDSCSALTTAVIPASVTVIDFLAFQGCGFTEVTLPKTLQQVGYMAFAYCPVEKLTVNTGADINGVFTYSSLKEVVFGDDATTIPSFKYADQLTDVTFPSALEALPSDAFHGCSSLETLNLPNTLTTIGDYAFYDCAVLKSLVIPEKVEYIGDGAFGNCTALKSLDIPEKVSYIGRFAFSNCTLFKTLRLPDAITTIQPGLFHSDANLEKVYISANVQEIGYGAFFGCTSLRSMVIPEGVKEIPSEMMQDCSALTEILIPNSVTKIGEYAFDGCTSLRNIDLGTGVYDIANYAFNNCTAITDIHSMAVNPPYAQAYTFPMESYSKATVTVQEQSLTRYKNENPWYRFENYMTVSGQVTLSHYSVDMAGNEVFQLGVYGANSDVKWTSSNPSVAYANECGLIVGMGITGSTVITAHVDGEEVKCNVTISAQKRQKPAKARALGDSDDKETVEPVDVIMEGVSGNPPMVNVRLVPVGACTVIDWTTSDSSVATVENGIVTIHSEGDVEFGVETENGLTETWDGDTEEIESGVEDIVVDQIEVRNDNVYNMQGMLIKLNATDDDIKALAPGFYIIGGKKVLVK